MTESILMIRAAAVAYLTGLAFRCLFFWDKCRSFGKIRPRWMVSTSVVGAVTCEEGSQEAPTSP